MAGKVIDDSASGVLILIIPFALAIVLLFTAWPLILVLFLLGAVLNIWQRYQWLKWSQQINPSFYQLIHVNQGCLTAMDLALKANISGRSAKQYLDTKAKEFGIRAIEYEDKGTVYYFTTSSTLNSLLDGSETPKEIAIAPSTASEQTSVETEQLEPESLTASEPTSVETEQLEPESLTASEPTSVAAPVETEQLEVETLTASEQPPVETEPPLPEPLTASEQTSVAVPVETEQLEVETLTASEPTPVETEPPLPETLTASEPTPVEEVETEPPLPESLSASEPAPVEERVETEEQTPVETEPPLPEPLTAEADTPKEAQTEAPAESHDEAQLEPAEKSPKKMMAFGSLIQIELANRLGVHSSTVYKRRYDSDFPEWSKSRDPQGIAWEYSEDTKEFYPIETK